MAGIYAPEINTIGASSLTGGLSAPQNIDYSGLFQTLNDSLEPKKVTETDLKSTARKNLIYDLNKIAALENTAEQQVQYRLINREAPARYSSLSREESSAIISQYTGELPFDEKSAQEIQTAQIMKAYETDPEMASRLTINMAKSEGNPDLFMQLSLADYTAVTTRRAEIDAIKTNAELKNLGQAEVKDQFIAKGIVASTQNVEDYIKAMPTLLQQGGYGNLSGDGLYTVMKSFAEQEEQKARNSARVEAARAGIVLSKEEEDRLVAPYTSTVSMFNSMSTQTQTALTAQNTEQMLRYKLSFEPEVRGLLDNPQMQDINIQALGGRPALEPLFRKQTIEKKGMFGPSVMPEAVGPVNTAVEGPPDSPTVLKERYQAVFSPESLDSALKFDDESKLSVISILRSDIQDVSRVDGYSVETANVMAKNFMYGYAMAIPEIDTDGTFTEPKAIETMFGSKAYSYAEALTKKSPDLAPDVWNKMNVMADVTADRVLVKLNQNLRIINETAFGDPLQNPFVFKMDQNGNITGSVSASAVSSNSYIKKTLAAYDVVNPEQIDQVTFWKVMRDYTSAFDKYEIVGGTNYSNVEDAVKSLQILAKTSMKIPGSQQRENAFTTISAGLNDMFSGRRKTIESMSPAEFSATLPREGTPRTRTIEGTR
jgi:hypothetical protein